MYKLLAVLMIASAAMLSVEAQEMSNPYATAVMNEMIGEQFASERAQDMRTQVEMDNILRDCSPKDPVVASSFSLPKWMESEEQVKAIEAAGGLR